jgi:hypothetical protein
LTARILVVLEYLGADTDKNTSPITVQITMPAPLDAHTQRKNDGSKSGARTKRPTHTKITPPIQQRTTYDASNYGGRADVLSVSGNVMLSLENWRFLFYVYAKSEILNDL